MIISLWQRYYHELVFNNNKVNLFICLHLEMISLLVLSREKASVFPIVNFSVRNRLHIRIQP